jgi:YbbR domain-containing protein
MRIPINQLFLIGLSVALSFLLWLWVGAQERSEIVVSVPLEYRNLARGMEIFPEKDLVTNVNVWVKGTTNTIKNLKPNEISCWVDLSGTKAGLRNFEIGPDQVKAPYGFSVLRITPSRISLRVEDVVSRKVPVTVRLEGEPAIGFKVTETSVKPSEVEIRGPQSAVASVRQAVTDSIDVSRIQGTHTETVNVGVENSLVRIAKTTSVLVSLNVSEITDVFTMRVPVLVGNTNAQVKFNPKTVRLDLVGPKTFFAQIKNEQIQVVLDVGALEPGVYELTPRVVLDPQAQKKVSVKDVIPPRIHVRIS